MPIAITMILVDTHVHIHRCYETVAFLDSASRNFRQAAAAACPDQPYRAVLCLTEDAGSGEFERLRVRADDHAGLDDWSFSRTGEPHSLLVSHRRYGELTILAGRQIRCAEGVEVLALGTCRQFEDGMSVNAAIDRTLDAGALAVLPWGFGKWTGRRGRLVRKLLGTRTPQEISLGDNSGRLAVCPEPREFALARQRGFRVLPGSDPLPFPAEITRAAVYGLVIAGSLGTTEPARDLVGILSSLPVRIRPFGRLETPFRFLRNQLAMQLVKRQMSGARA